MKTESTKRASVRISRRQRDALNISQILSGVKHFCINKFESPRNPGISGAPRNIVASCRDPGRCRLSSERRGSGLCPCVQVTAPAPVCDPLQTGLSG